MNKPRLEVVHFDMPDIIVTSGIATGELGMKVSGFGDDRLVNGKFELFGASGGPATIMTRDESQAHENFSNYFDYYSWGSLDKICLEGPGSPDSPVSPVVSVQRLISNDSSNDSDIFYSKFNGIYSFSNGLFTWRSN